MNKNQRIKLVVVVFLALSIAVGGFYLAKINNQEEVIVNPPVEEPPQQEPVIEEPDDPQEEPIDIEQEEPVDIQEEEPIVEEPVEEDPVEEEPEIEEPIVEEPIIEKDPEESKTEEKPPELPQTNEYSFDGNYVNLQVMNYDYLEEPGWLIHYEDDNYVSILGVDISEYSGNVNFYRLKEIGVDFVMMRVGWRGSTEGGLYEDKYWEAYYTEAQDAGLDIGYYFYSQATSDEEAIEEAEFVLERISDKQCDMFVAFDMELPDHDSRIAGMSKSEITSAALAFANRIVEEGYVPMVYANNDWSKNYYNMSDLSGIPIWYAQYNGYPHVNFDYAMWQYTGSASISATQNKGYTDLNLILIEK